MKYLFVLFLVPTLALAAPKEWAVESGVLTYTVNHKLHTVTGISKEVKGIGRCDSSCQFLVAAPVKSFGSESASRDSNMQQITRAAVNPMVELRVATTPAPGKQQAEAEVKFAGKSHKYSLALDFAQEKSGYRVRTKIPLKLTDFEIERPSLFGVSVDDEAPVDVDLVLVAK